LSTESIWQAFQETGDPVYYMLYKSALKKEEQERKQQKKTGTPPRQDQLPRADG